MKSHKFKSGSYLLKRMNRRREIFIVTTWTLTLFVGERKNEIIIF